jgi:hypothetical protein
MKWFCQFKVANGVEPTHSRLFVRLGKVLDGLWPSGLIKLLLITAGGDVPREKLQ